MSTWRIVSGGELAMEGRYDGAQTALKCQRRALGPQPVAGEASNR